MNVERRKLRATSRAGAFENPRDIEPDIGIDPGQCDAFDAMPDVDFEFDARNEQELQESLEPRRYAQIHVMRGRFAMHRASIFVDTIRSHLTKPWKSR